MAKTMSTTPESTPTRDRQALRVDHAGEHGAVAIYRGQRAVFGRNAATQGIARDLAHMEAEEQKHRDAFDRLLIERGVRPTALMPLWNAAGYGLGVVTALMGERAAHACTEAVETVIEEHYADQAAETRDPALRATFTEFRDDELAHRDIAIAGGAKEAVGYRALSGVIKAGCRVAIGLTKRV